VRNLRAESQSSTTVAEQHEQKMMILNIAPDGIESVRPNYTFALGPFALGSFALKVGPFALIIKKYLNEHNKYCN
jgi:hypothetical protein